jgi:hypothetical protein
MMLCGDERETKTASPRYTVAAMANTIGRTDSRATFTDAPRPPVWQCHWT